jgi:hypothetical protein
MNDDIHKDIEDPFIHIEENNLSKELCDQIIERFKNDIRKRPGLTMGGMSNKKVTHDLVITLLDDWKDIDQILFTNLHQVISNYLKREVRNNKNEIIYYSHFQSCLNIQDFGYQIQHYNKGAGYYNWHDDSCIYLLPANQSRFLSFIWYLNDVETGGETEFLNGKIKPSTGKIVLFPATWTYVHKGCMPISNDKYIITGWIGTKFIDDSIFKKLHNYILESMNS